MGNMDGTTIKLRDQDKEEVIWDIKHDRNTSKLTV